MKRIYVEKLEGHAPMALSIELRTGRRPSPFTIRAVASFMREYDIEELEVYYGQEAVKSAFPSASPGKDNPSQEKVESGIREQVETKPVDGPGLGVQPSEAEVPSKPKKKVRRAKEGGKSLIR